jgi:hypothetical protein
MSRRAAWFVTLALVCCTLLVTSVGAQKTVHVKGYTKKDGTVVKPHERRAPGTSSTTPTTAPATQTAAPAAEASPAQQVAPVPLSGAEPTTVYVVLSGSGATALYHRADCPWLKLGTPTAYAVEEAKKRYFQPHCLCLTGHDGTPPCTATSAAASVPESRAPAPEPHAAVVSAVAAARTSTTTTADVNEVVYVTKTGTKYHTAGCRFLSKSSRPIALKDAVRSYSPCSVCQPPTLPK